MSQNSLPKSPSSGKDELTTMFSALRAPFSESQIRWRVGARSKDRKRGQAIPYPDPRQVQNRLDEIVGPQNWRAAFVEVANGVLCRLSIRCGDEWVTKEDAASFAAFAIAGTDEDSARKRDLGLKGAFTDAFNRACVMWGIGRYLYNYNPQWVPLRDGKYLAERPRLPLELLPEGERAAAQAPTPEAASVPAPESSQPQEAVRMQELVPETPTTEAVVANADVQPEQEMAISEASPASQGSEAQSASEHVADASETPAAEETPPPIGTKEQWASLVEGHKGAAVILIERIRRGVALHSIDEYLLNGRGKELPEWLRNALLAKLAEKRGAPITQAEAA